MTSGGWAMGPAFEITGQRQAYSARRFAKRHTDALDTGSHLWVATVGYFLPEKPSSALLFDQDNIIGPPILGCFICEQRYSVDLINRRCPGSPDGALWSRGT